MKADQKNISLSTTLGNAELTNLAWATSVSIPQKTIPVEYLKNLPPEGALIVRLSDNQCSSCIDQLLFEIRKYMKDIGPEKMVVMYSSKNDHQIIQAYRLRLLAQVKFIKVPIDVELTPLDQYRIPYFFLINDAGEVQTTFLPYPATEKFTGIFLNHIATQFKSYEK